MFRKDPYIKPSSNLKGSERKKLLQLCKEQTCCEEYTFPSNTIKEAKYTAKSSMGTVYLDENTVPIWLKEKHNVTLLPTVYTCWINPHLLPVVLTHEIVIEERILNGANLMLAGTVPPFDSRLKPGVICGIASKEHPERVMAIGKVLLDLQTYDSVIGKTGVAVEVLHYLGDGLSHVLKVKLEPPVRVENNSEENTDQETTRDDSVTEDLKKVTPSTDVNDMAEFLSELRVEDIDHFFTRSLYYTLTNDTKLSVPITSSNFIANHILNNLPPIDHNQVTMKKTSWKKTAKFLKHFEKEGFIKLKGKGDDLIIVGVNKEKPELKSFTTYKIGGSNNANGPKKIEKNTDGSKMMYSETFYKPKNLGKTFVLEVDLPPKFIYDTKELQNAVNEYITEKKLIDSKNPKRVLLDDLLFAMIKSKKTQKDDPRLIFRAEIFTPFLENNFQPFFQLYNCSDEPLFKHPIKGPLSSIHIETEMKMGRKVVTKLSNFEHFQIDPDAVAVDLKRICNASTTMGETMISPKTAEVQVQGAHVSTVTEYLNKKGVPTKWIDVNDRVKKTKKKRH